MNASFKPFHIKSSPGKQSDYAALVTVRLLMWNSVQEKTCKVEVTGINRRVSSKEPLRAAVWRDSVVVLMGLMLWN